MKSKFYMAVLLVVSLVSSQQIFAQANTALSNLVTPTAVNRDLSPGSNNTLNLGVGATNWKNIYIGGLYYLKNLRIMHAPGTSNFFAGPNAGNLATTGTFNAGIGNQAMELNTTGSNNTALGYTALRSNTLGGRNTAVGLTALYKNTGGGYNTAIGERTMYNNITGIYNSGIGSLSLFTNSTGAGNSGLGYQTLYNNTTGGYNVAVGYQALLHNTTGTKNTTIGYLADVSSAALSNATAIGANAQVTVANGLVLGSVSGINGAAATVNVGIGTVSPSSRLHVVGNQLLDGNLTFATGTESIQFANPGGTPAPMIYMFQSGTVNTNRMLVAHSPAYPNWGLQYTDVTDQFDFIANGTSKMAVNLSSGNVGIGVVSPIYRLEVCGTIRAKEVRVETGWCDYVFEKDYKLRSIEELEKYINDNKHLPGIAPASEVEKEGLKVGEMNKAMMEKIEELSLYIIQVSKENKRLQAEIDALKQK